MSASGERGGGGGGAAFPGARRSGTEEKGGTGRSPGILHVKKEEQGEPGTNTTNKRDCLAL